MQVPICRRSREGVPTGIGRQPHDVRVASPVRLAHLPTSEDDAALVARVTRGDREAFGQLYDRHAPLLRAVALRMLGGQREAQDLVHDVFLEAWEDVRRYHATRGTVRTWLLVRLRSRALDRLGRAEVLRTTSLEHSPDSRSRAVTAPPAVEGIAVRQALARMDGDVREVLDCTFFGGLTAREIAARTGAPLGTVKSRLARGLVAIGTLLEPGGPSHA